jgi:flagellar basal-body rod modification protein FlgD
MSIAGITPTTSAATASTSSAQGSGIIGKDDFLRLLVTQLQKQDPLNPQDPTEFTSQLTQFSSLEQLIGVNDNIKTLITQGGLSSEITAAGYIGKTAKVKGDLLSVSDGTAVPVHFSLPADSTKTNVNIYDASGKLIKVVDLGTLKAGDHDFQWDAKTASGSSAPDSSYRFEVTAQDAQAQALTVTSSFTGQITGVSFENGQAMLNIGGQKWPLGDLVSIGG